MCSSYTCITCRVAFKDVDIQRLHYKTDWHRYNLKRKVVELPPVTSEEFEKRVLLQREKDNETQDKNVYCKICRKNFNSAKSYENHLNSKRHKENEAARNQAEAEGSDDEEITHVTTTNMTSKSKTQPIVTSKHSEQEMLVETDSEIEELDSDEWDEDLEETENPINNNDCLFCSQHSQTLAKNITHMSVQHSFFIPDIEFCVDIKGLLSYLGEKITEGFMCIWCNDRGRTFHSSEAARNHMLDKGHCKMLHEGLALAEYADFYDYSSSYPDHDDISSTNEMDVDDSEISEPNVLDDSDFQLVLPSGITVGHRSLLRYYKQCFDPNRQVVKASENTKKLHKVLAQYRSLGWSETQQKQAARKAKDLHFMKRVQSKWNMKLGVNANKLQKHFRVQCNF